MNTPLSPTLWRTCRALAHESRLATLQTVFANTEVCVTDIALIHGVPMARASRYLRTLQARGLISAQRQSQRVLYRAIPNPAVRYAAALLEALRATLDGSDEAIHAAYRDFTACTHPRRPVIIAMLAAKPQSRLQLRQATGFSPVAVGRHLTKLMDRRFVTEEEDILRLAEPSTPLARLLITLCITDSSE